jgi:hypothetical protein
MRAKLDKAGADEGWLSRRMPYSPVADQKAAWKEWAHKCIQRPLPHELGRILQAVEDLRRPAHSFTSPTNKPIFNTPEQQAAYETKRNDLIEAWNQEWSKLLRFGHDDLPPPAPFARHYDDADHLPPSLAALSFAAAEDLRGINLRNAHLGQPPQELGDPFGGVNLTQADLRNANLFRNSFHSATLDNADLSGAYLVHTNFYHAKLRGAKLTNADLRKANFYNADLTNANLCGADLTGARLYGAVLDGADLRNTKGLLVDGNSVYRTQFNNIGPFARMYVSLFHGLKWVFELFGSNEFSDMNTDVEDRWSMLRRLYTGPSFFISLLFLVSFTIPYVAKALFLTEVGRSEVAVLERFGLPNNDRQTDSAGNAPSRGIAAEYQFLQERINDALANARAASTSLTTLAASRTDQAGELHALISPIQLELEQVEARMEYVGRHVGDIVLQSIAERRYPVWKVLLGVDTGNYASTLLICLLLVYNAGKWLMTVSVAPMRDAEDRVQRTPARMEYQALMPAHRIVSILYWLSFGTAIYDLAVLLATPVYKFW